MEKDGPIDFYIQESEAYLTDIVLRCVHVGEHQHMPRVTAQYHICRGDIFLDGTVCSTPERILNAGVHTLKIRDKIHHVRIAGTIKE